MTLEGAKFICLDEAGNRGEIVLAKGRKFSVGYYTSCDLPIEDERAKGVHCTIECDAFGRITIRNFCSENPIAINGEVVENQRILFNKTTIKILDKSYLWEYATKNAKEFEDVASGGDVSTPQKQIGIPQPSAFSCPGVKRTQKTEPRFTVHNFAYCIQSDEEGNTSIEDNNEVSIVEEPEPSTKSEAKQDVDKDSLKSQPPSSTCEEKRVEREVTPEREGEKPSKEAQETPKMNLINCTINKENSSSTQKKNHLQLSLCHQSDVVITSFSPREAGVKTEKSFTAILKPKVLVTRAPNTPKSVYSTPKSVLGDDEDEIDKSRDVINFHTPSTSRKTTKNQKNTSMHLVDYTTPNKLAPPPASPYLKSALKASAKKLASTPSAKTGKIKVNTEEYLQGVSALPITPMVSDESKNKLETPGSVISVASTDTSSVIEILSDESTPGTNANILLKTPGKTETGKAAATTPMRTPQSLMKRAILTSTKKQITTPQRSEAAPVTPRREPINRIPLRTSIGSLRSPVTPKTTGPEAPSSRRLSMSTPSRKSMSAVTKRFENTPSSTVKATATPSTSRRSSLIPMSASRAQTSTPFSHSSRNKSACKTSPLNKVRKSVGGVPLSSHISKARRSIIASSPSQYKSIKEKSPQQVMSDRLVSRARKSLGVTPMLSRAITMVQTAKEARAATPSSILKRQQSARKSMAATTSTSRSVLFADKQKKLTDEGADLSLTFVVDSDEEDDNKKMEAKERSKPKDVTFSPEETADKKPDKSLNATFSPEKEKTINLTFSPGKDPESKGLDIPIDVDELIEEDENDSNTVKSQGNDDEVIPEELSENEDHQLNDKVIPAEEPQESQEEQADTTENETTAADESKTCATEESFAEIISDSLEEKEIVKEINDDEEIDENLIENVEEINKTPEETEIDHEEIDEILIENVEEINKTPEETEIGFGEESLVGKQAAFSNNIPEKINDEKLQLDVIELDDSTVEEIDLEKSLKDTKESKEILDKSSSVYKPICEDITLEGSLIEKDAKEKLAKADDSLCEEIEVAKTSNAEPLPEDSFSEELLAMSEAEANKSTIEEQNITEPLEELSVKEEQTEEKKLSAEKENAIESESLSESLLEESVTDEHNKSQTESADKSSAAEQSKTETLPKQSKGTEELEEIENTQSVEKSNLTKSESITEVLLEESVTEEQNKSQHEADKLPATEQNETVPLLVESVTEELEEIENTLSVEKTTETLLEESVTEEQNKSQHEADKSSVTEQNETQPLAVESVTEELESNVVKEKGSESLLEDSSSNKLDNSQNEAVNTCDKLLEEENDTSQSEENKTSAEIQKATEPLSDDSMSEELDKSQAENDKSSTEEQKITEPLPDKSQTETLNEQAADESQSEEVSIEEKNETKKAENVIEDIETVAAPKDAVEQNNLSEINENELNTSEAQNAAESLKETDEQIAAENVEVSKDALEQKYTAETENDFNDSAVENDSKLSKVSDEIMSTDKHHSISDLQSTSSKLLEQIEDVLNKSDEIKQKHLEENEEDCESINTLTEENESVKLTQDSISDYQQSEGGGNETTVDKEAEECQDLNTDSSEDNKKVENITEETTKTNKVVSENQAETTEEEAENHASKEESKVDVEINSTENENNESVAKEQQKTTAEDREDDNNKTDSPTLLSVKDDDVVAKPSHKLIECHSKTCTPKRRSRRASMLVESTDDTKENIDISLQNVAKKLIEDEKETSAITPRRSLRRKSISNTVTESIDGESNNEVKPLPTFTPRRSARRASISSETTNATNTPTAKKTRRASLSAVSEAYLTPKRITRRRSSISLDSDEVIKVVHEPTAAAQREQQISEEINEDMGAIIEEEEDEEAASESVVAETTKLTVEDTVKGAQLTEDSVKVVIEENVCEIVSETPPATLDPQGSPKSQDANTKDVSTQNEEIEKDCRVDANAIIATESDVVKDLTEEKESSQEKAGESVQDEIIKGEITPQELTKDVEEDIIPVEESVSEKANDSVQEAEQLVNSEDIVEDVSPEEDMLTLLVSDDDDRDEEEEANKVDNTKGFQKPEIKKSVRIAADSPKTPVMSGMRELLKTPKREPNTPTFKGIRHLVRTPKSKPIETEEEESDKLQGLQELVKTPTSKVAQAEELSGEEETNTNEEEHKDFRGVKELLKTPKTCSTPRFKGMRELMKTPKASNTPALGGVKELLDTPISQKSENEDNETTPATPKKVDEDIDAGDVKELLKTPTSSVTPRFKGMRELMKTPKESGTPALGGVKELLDTPKLESGSEDVLSSDTEDTALDSEAADEEKDLKVVKEILKTPKSTATPRFKSMREIVKTPKVSGTPVLSGVKELLDTATQDSDDTNTDTLAADEEKYLKVVKELQKTPKSTATPLEMQTPKVSGTTVLSDTQESVNEVVLNSDTGDTALDSAAADEEKDLKGVKVLLKTPKSTATPRFKGMRELMKTPKVSGTPVLSGVKELLDTPKHDSVIKDVVNSDTDDTKTDNMSADEEKDPKVVKELLKTPKSTAASRVVQTTKDSGTHVLGGVNELLDTSKQESVSEDVVNSDTEDTASGTVAADEEKNLKGVKELLKTPKSIATPRFKGVRELMKTPKVSVTPVLSGVKELMDTPNKESENNDLEIISATSTEVLDIDGRGVKELLKTPKSTATPRFKGMRELMQTPKRSCTPALGGVKELLETPKQESADDNVDITEADVVTSGSLAKDEETKSKVIKDLLNTPKSTATPRFKGVRELMKTPKVVDTPILTGVKELLNDSNVQQQQLNEGVETTVADLKAVKELPKTPKTLGTPCFKGMRKLMQTPKSSSTPNLGGVKELLDDSTEEQQNTDGNDDGKEIHQTENADVPTTSSKDPSTKHLKGVKELLKTPKGCSTPRFKGMRELMQTPKMTSTPVLCGLKDLMETPKAAQEEDDDNLDKFLKTPTAKNIMISTLPSSAIIEKNEDSVEMVHSTEYDLNDTHEGGSVHLEELFKTPVASRFVERITDSFYGEDEEGPGIEESNKTANESTAKMQTPLRKGIPRKSLLLNTPKFQSPFSAADVLSDLSKTEVEEWVGKVDPLQQTIGLDDDVEVEVTKQNLNDSIIELNESLSEVPETCTKSNAANKSDVNVGNKSEAMINVTALEEGSISKDPLASTAGKLKASEKRPRTPIIDNEADISGINLLDQTGESALDGSLLVSEDDEEEEGDNNDANQTLTDSLKPQDGEQNETLCEYDNDLSESLVVSDSEELEKDPNESLAEKTCEHNEVNEKLTSSEVVIALAESTNKEESQPTDLEKSVEENQETEISKEEATTESLAEKSSENNEVIENLTSSEVVVTLDESTNKEESQPTDLEKSVEENRETEISKEEATTESLAEKSTENNEVIENLPSSEVVIDLDESTNKEESQPTDLEKSVEEHQETELSKENDTNESLAEKSSEMNKKPTSSEVVIDLDESTNKEESQPTDLEKSVENQETEISKENDTNESSAEKSSENNEVNEKLTSSEVVIALDKSTNKEESQLTDFEKSVEENRETEMSKEEGSPVETKETEAADECINEEKIKAKPTKSLAKTPSVECEDIFMDDSIDEDTTPHYSNKSAESNVETLEKPHSEIIEITSDESSGDCKVIDPKAAGETPKKDTKNISTRECEDIFLDDSTVSEVSSSQKETDTITVNVESSSDDGNDKKEESEGSDNSTEAKLKINDKIENPEDVINIDDSNSCEEVPESTMNENLVTETKCQYQENVKDKDKPNENEDLIEISSQEAESNKDDISISSQEISEVPDESEGLEETQTLNKTVSEELVEEITNMDEENKAIDAVVGTIAKTDSDDAAEIKEVESSSNDNTEKDTETSSMEDTIEKPKSTHVKTNLNDETKKEENITTEESERENDFPEVIPLSENNESIIEKEGKTESITTTEVSLPTDDKSKVVEITTEVSEENVALVQELNTPESEEIKTVEGNSSAVEENVENLDVSQQEVTESKVVGTTTEISEGEPVSETVALVEELMATESAEEIKTVEGNTSTVEENVENLDISEQGVTESEPDVATEKFTNEIDMDSEEVTQKTESQENIESSKKEEHKTPKVPDATQTSTTSEEVTHKSESKEPTEDIASNKNEALKISKVSDATHSTLDTEEIKAGNNFGESRTEEYNLADDSMESAENKEPQDISENETKEPKSDKSLAEENIEKQTITENQEEETTKTEASPEDNESKETESIKEKEPVTEAQLATTDKDEMHITKIDDSTDEPEALSTSADVETKKPKSSKDVEAKLDATKATEVGMDVTNPATDTEERSSEVSKTTADEAVCAESILPESIVQTQNEVKPQNKLETSTSFGEAAVEDNSTETSVAEEKQEFPTSTTEDEPTTITKIDAAATEVSNKEEKKDEQKLEICSEKSESQSKPSEVKAVRQSQDENQTVATSSSEIIADTKSTKEVEATKMTKEIVEKDSVSKSSRKMSETPIVVGTVKTYDIEVTITDKPKPNIVEEQTEIEKSDHHHEKPKKRNARTRKGSQTSVCSTDSSSELPKSKRTRKNSKTDEDVVQMEANVDIELPTVMESESADEPIFISEQCKENKASQGASKSPISTSGSHPEKTEAEHITTESVQAIENTEEEACVKPKVAAKRSRRKGSADSVHSEDDSVTHKRKAVIRKDGGKLEKCKEVPEEELDNKTSEDAEALHALQVEVQDQTEDSKAVNKRSRRVASQDTLHAAGLSAKKEVDKSKQDKIDESKELLSVEIQTEKADNSKDLPKDSAEITKEPTNKRGGRRKPSQDSKYSDESVITQKGNSQKQHISAAEGKPDQDKIKETPIATTSEVFALEASIEQNKETDVLRGAKRAEEQHEIVKKAKEPSTTRCRRKASQDSNHGDDSSSTRIIGSSKEDSKADKDTALNKIPEEVLPTKEIEPNETESVPQEPQNLEAKKESEEQLEESNDVNGSEVVKTGNEAEETQEIAKTEKEPPTKCGRRKGILDSNHGNDSTSVRKDGDSKTDSKAEIGLDNIPVEVPTKEIESVEIETVPQEKESEATKESAEQHEGAKQVKDSEEPQEIAKTEKEPSSKRSRRKASQDSNHGDDSTSTRKAVRSKSHSKAEEEAGLNKIPEEIPSKDMESESVPQDKKLENLKVAEESEEPHEEAKTVKDSEEHHDTTKLSKPSAKRVRRKASHDSKHDVDSTSTRKGSRPNSDNKADEGIERSKTETSEPPVPQDNKSENLEVTKDSGEQDKEARNVVNESEKAKETEEHNDTAKPAKEPSAKRSRRKASKDSNHGDDSSSTRKVDSTKTDSKADEDTALDKIPEEVLATKEIEANESVPQEPQNFEAKKESEEQHEESKGVNDSEVVKTGKETSKTDSKAETGLDNIPVEIPTNEMESIETEIVPQEKEPEVSPATKESEEQHDEAKVVEESKEVKDTEEPQEIAKTEKELSSKRSRRKASQDSSHGDDSTSTRKASRSKSHSKAEEETGLNKISEEIPSKEIESETVPQDKKIDEEAKSVNDAEEAKEVEKHHDTTKVSKPSAKRVRRKASHDSNHDDASTSTRKCSRPKANEGVETTKTETSEPPVPQDKKLEPLEVMNESVELPKEAKVVEESEKAKETEEHHDTVKPSKEPSVKRSRRKASQDSNHGDDSTSMRKVGPSKADKAGEEAGLNKIAEENIPKVIEAIESETLPQDNKILEGTEESKEQHEEAKNENEESAKTIKELCNKRGREDSNHGDDTTTSPKIAKSDKATDSDKVEEIIPTKETTTSITEVADVEGASAHDNEHHESKSTKQVKESVNKRSRRKPGQDTHEDDSSAPNVRKCSRRRGAQLVEEQEISETKNTEESRETKATPAVAVEEISEENDHHDVVSEAVKDEKKTSDEKEKKHVKKIENTKELVSKRTRRKDHHDECVTKEVHVENETLETSDDKEIDNNKGASNKQTRRKGRHDDISADEVKDENKPLETSEEKNNEKKKVEDTENIKASSNKRTRRKDHHDDVAEQVKNDKKPLEKSEENDSETKEVEETENTKEESVHTRTRRKDHHDEHEHVHDVKTTTSHARRAGRRKVDVTADEKSDGDKVEDAIPITSTLPVEQPTEDKEPETKPTDVSDSKIQVEETVKENDQKPNRRKPVEDSSHEDEAHVETTRRGGRRGKGKNVHEPVESMVETKEDKKSDVTDTEKISQESKVGEEVTEPHSSGRVRRKHPHKDTPQEVENSSKHTRRVRHVSVKDDEALETIGQSESNQNLTKSEADAIDDDNKAEEKEHKDEDKPANKRNKRHHTIPDDEPPKRRAKHRHEEENTEEATDENKPAEKEDVGSGKDASAKTEDQHEEHETKKATRRRGGAQHHENDEHHDEKSSVRSRRGRKLAGEEETPTPSIESKSEPTKKEATVAEHHISPEKTTKSTRGATRTVRTKHHDDNQHEDNEHDHEETTKAAAASKRKAGGKQDHVEDHDDHEHEVTTKAVATKRKAGAKLAHDTTNEVKAPVSRRRGRKQDSHEDDDHDVIVDTHEEKSPVEAAHSTEEGAKKGRIGRRKRGDDHKESEEHHPAEHASTSHAAAETKTPKTRKRKESHTEQEHHTTHQVDTVAQPETPPRVQSSNEENIQTPDSEKRARNIPQRRAAIVHHNYDETSDSEKQEKKKKKTESPPKASEPVVAAASVLTETVKSGESSSDQSPALLTSTTTARGRTRKPTARVQQFLEEERAKAESPKKRGGAILSVPATETPTKRQPTKRGGKAAAVIESEIHPSTPETSKRGRGRHAVETEEASEQSNTEIHEPEHTTPPPATSATAKVRKGARKAKANVHSEPDDVAMEEPPAKKSPLQLEAEKKDVVVVTSPEKSDEHTPARTTGRRNAAAAAKARIEEDALAAAAVEAPKKSKAKKSPVKTATAPPTAGKREHRIASASTVDGNEDLQTAAAVGDEEQQKTAPKRGTRKAAVATSATDSPAVPAKRSRKAKAAEEPDTTEVQPEEPKTSRAVRGRKNVAPTPPVSSATPVDSVEPAEEKAVEEQPTAATTKRATRVRRK